MQAVRRSSRGRVRLAVLLFALFFTVARCRSVLACPWEYIVGDEITGAPSITKPTVAQAFACRNQEVEFEASLSTWSDTDQRKLISGGNFGPWPDNIKYEWSDSSGRDLEDAFKNADYDTETQTETITWIAPGSTGTYTVTVTGHDEANMEEGDIQQPQEPPGQPNSRDDPQAPTASLIMTVVKVEITTPAPESFPVYACVDGNLSLVAAVTPEDGGTYTWSPDTGPATPTFTPNGTANTTFSTDTAGTYTVRVTYAKGLAACSDTSGNIVVIEADLIIHKGLDGVSGGQVISEADEETTGAVTVANLNDTDGDETVDKDDNDVSVSGANPPGRNEHDLMKLVLEEPQPSEAIANVRVRIVSGDVKIYKPGPSGKEQSKSNGEATLTQGIAAFTSDSNGNGNDDIVWWVEARSQTALRGIELVYECQPIGDGEWITCDTVKATGLWVESTTRSPWRIRETTSGLPNNPEPGPDKDLPDLNDASLANAINSTVISVDGSRYGFGTCFKQGANDTRVGGRILWELEIKPHGVENLGVVFDITRQTEHRIRELSNGSGTWSTPVADDEFPEDQTPTDDNETPNDDAGTSDEDNQHSNHLIYSFDIPSTSITAGNRAFVVMRHNFREWVRIKLSGSFTNNNGLEEGSRASNKEDWHFLQYLKRDSNSQMVQDSAETSYSGPVFTGAGNGTIAVTLLANAETEGFTATYDEPNKKWTLTGTVGGDSDDDTHDPAPQGTQWTLTIGTKVQVVITQGSTAFGDGAEFKFSVFKTAATNGKQNEIDTGSIDVTDGP